MCFNRKVEHDRVTVEKKNWIKEMAERAYRYCNGRKIVSWGYFAPSFDIDKTLSELYGLRIDFYVDADTSLVDEVHVFSPEILSEEYDNYYVIVPLAFYQSIKDSLIRWGYKDTDYYYFSDCVIENNKKLYLDRHGNKIVNPPRNVKCSFWGYDNLIEFPEMPGFYTKTAITMGSENKLKIGSKEIRDTSIFMWEGNSGILGSESTLCNNQILFMSGNNFAIGMKSCVKNSGIQLYYRNDVCIADYSTYEGNVELEHESIISIEENSNVVCCFTGYSGSRFSVGKKVRIGSFSPAFSQKNIFLALGKSEIIIDDNCLLSINIKLICGDGHSIFDMETGENLNSAQGMDHKIIIHKHVWVGVNTVLLAGAEIGEDCIVGAGSIVNKEFSENCVIAGNPAKVVRENRTWDFMWGQEKMSEEGEK